MEGGASFDGNQFWSKVVRQGLIKEKIGTHFWYFYENVPYSLYASLSRSRNMWEDRICMVDDDGTQYTYGQLWNMVNGFADYLQQTYHVKPGMRVGVLLYNSVEFCASIYAINKLRAIAVPFSTKYKQPETAALVERADLSVMIFHEDFSSWFRETETRMLLVEMGQHGLDGFQNLKSKTATAKVGQNHAEPEQLWEIGSAPKAFLMDDAILMFTSGTTSRSKGVRMTNYNVMHAIAVYQKIFDVTEKDRTVIPVPMYHVTGLIGLMGLFLHSGGCMWLHKYFNAERVLQEIEDHKLTFFHASPTVFSLLLEKKEQYPNIRSIRILACGSSNMPIEKIKELKKWVPQAEFRTIYGLTETSSPATIFPEDASGSDYIGSSGQPVPGMEFKICDDQLKTLACDEIGTIMLRGTATTPGYYKQDDGLTTDGWLDTGDMGYFNRDGYLYIVDRKKDMINRGGEKVCSLDVENALYKISGILEVAVVGIADERYGEVPAALIVLENESDLTEESIKNTLKTQLARFQIPQKIVFTHELPVTANMKVDKKKIRKMLSVW